MVLSCICSQLLGLQANVCIFEELVRLGLREDSAKELASSVPVDDEDVNAWDLLEAKIANAPSMGYLGS